MLHLEMPEADSSFNVAAETGDRESLLSHYRTLIFLRNAHPALRTGRLYLLPPPTRVCSPAFEPR